MGAITAEALIDIALPLLFYFAVGTLGAFTKDLYETMTGKIEKIRLGEVLVGGVVTSIICLGLSESIFKDFSLNTMFLVTFVIGVLGFEIFGNMTNIAKIRNLLMVIDEVRKGVPPSQNDNRNTDTQSGTGYESGPNDAVNNDSAIDENSSLTNEEDDKFNG